MWLSLTNHQNWIRHYISECLNFRDIPKNIQKNCWMAYLSSSLLCLVPILQSIITSSGSSLSTRWRGFSRLSPSPSPEQKRRVATSPSRCEYSTASHQAYFTSHLCRFDTYNMQLGFQLYKERKQVGETSGHTWKQLKMLYEREL